MSPPIDLPQEDAFGSVVEKAGVVPEQEDVPLMKDEIPGKSPNLVADTR
jgi:hypothetical protein